MSHFCLILLIFAGAYLNQTIEFFLVFIKNTTFAAAPFFVSKKNTIFLNYVEFGLKLNIFM